MIRRTGRAICRGKRREPFIYGCQIKACAGNRGEKSDRHTDQIVACRAEVYKMVWLGWAGRNSLGQHVRSARALVNDGLKESAKSFRVALSNPTGGVTLLSPSTAELTIVDNDTPASAFNPIDGRHLKFSLARCDRDTRPNTVCRGGNCGRIYFFVSDLGSNFVENLVFFITFHDVSPNSAQSLF